MTEPTPQEGLDPRGSDSLDGSNRPATKRRSSPSRCQQCGGSDLNVCLPNNEWQALTGLETDVPALICIHCLDAMVAEQGLAFTAYFFWKGEAGQAASYEPENPAWVAFRDEEWQRQMRLADDRLTATRTSAAGGEAP